MASAGQKPLRSEQRQRQQRLVIRLTAAEWAEVHQRAAAAQMSVAGYVRSTMFATPAPAARRQRAPVKDGRALALILAQLGKIGSNVNQLAYAANTHLWPQAALWTEARQDIRTMRDLLMVALGAQRPAPPAQDPPSALPAYDPQRL